MIEKVNMNTVPKKPLNQYHGEKVLYQMVIGRGTSKPDLMRSIKGVARMTIPSGETNLMHNHPKEEQIYIVLQGSGEIQLGDEKKDARAGDVIYLPANIPHGFYNTGKSTAIILNIGATVS